MNPYQRSHVCTLVRRLAETPTFIHALFGPRQTGKTTIARQALGRTDLPSRYLAVDEPEAPGFPSPYDETAATFRLHPQRDTEWLVRQWEEARLEAERSPRGSSVLVLDEIQEIEGWSETVKGLWDADRHSGCPLHAGSSVRPRCSCSRG